MLPLSLIHRVFGIRPDSASRKLVHYQLWCGSFKLKHYRSVLIVWIGPAGRPSSGIPDHRCCGSWSAPQAVVVRRGFLSTLDRLQDSEDLLFLVPRLIVLFQDDLTKILNCCQVQFSGLGSGVQVSSGAPATSRWAGTRYHSVYGRRTGSLTVKTFKCPTIPDRRDFRNTQGTLNECVFSLKLSV